MNNLFYLRNGGFFNDRTILNSWFDRPLTGKKPATDTKEPSLIIGDTDDKKPLII